MKTPNLTAAIAEIDRHLAGLDGDLSRMPAFKRGTAWHTDRTRARAGLVERREGLSALAFSAAPEVR